MFSRKAPMHPAKLTCNQITDFVFFHHSGMANTHNENQASNDDEQKPKIEQNVKDIVEGKCLSRRPLVDGGVDAHSHQQGSKEPEEQVEEEHGVLDPWRDECEVLWNTKSATMRRMCWNVFEKEYECQHEAFGHRKYKETEMDLNGLWLLHGPRTIPKKNWKPTPVRSCLHLWLKQCTGFYWRGWASVEYDQIWRDHTYLGQEALPRHVYLLPLWRQHWFNWQRQEGLKVGLTLAPVRPQSVDAWRGINEIGQWTQVTWERAILWWSNKRTLKLMCLLFLVGSVIGVKKMLRADDPETTTCLVNFQKIEWIA